LFLNTTLFYNFMLPVKRYLTSFSSVQYTYCISSASERKETWNCMHFLVILSLKTLWAGVKLWRTALHIQTVLDVYNCFTCIVSLYRNDPTPRKIDRWLVFQTLYTHKCPTYKNILLFMNKFDRWFASECIINEIFFLYRIKLITVVKYTFNMK
jgi:hypothetical protein